MLLYAIVKDTDRVKLSQEGHVLLLHQDQSSAIPLLKRCDGLVFRSCLITESNQLVLSKAQSLEMPIFDLDSCSDVPMQRAEIRCPQQCSAFIDLIMGLYRLHLKKNADYSPANILGTGEIGVITRLWDKIARLLYLYGFDIQISHSRFAAPRAPKNESIDDSLMDAAVYSIIGLLLRQDKWGK